MPLLLTSEKCRAKRRGKKKARIARIDFYTPGGGGVTETANQSAVSQPITSRLAPSDFKHCNGICAKFALGGG